MKINAIFEGGGIKGLAYVGVLRFLEKRGFQFNKVGGTSVGAVFAALIAAGYNSYEIEELVNDFNPKILTSMRGRRSEKIINGIKKKGLYSIVNFEKYLYSVLKDKKKIYFGSVKRGDEYLLKMVATDIKKRKEVILPEGLIAYGIDPDSFGIAKGVAMSCSIPLFFQPYRLGEHVFCDGGVVNNFPITLFSDDEIPTLGFRLSESPLQKAKGIFSKLKKKPLYDFDKYNIIRINTFGIKATDFEKGMEKRLDLYISGYNSIRQYFYQRFDFWL
ncbi:MAG: patatin-like phospholipase family protein [Bacilli bacterium]|nr:patatin-like phospholipase family protein [Acholeplasmataceae bacterium]